MLRLSILSEKPATTFLDRDAAASIKIKYIQPPFDLQSLSSTENEISRTEANMNEEVDHSTVGEGKGPHPDSSLKALQRRRAEWIMGTLHREDAVII